jgi:ABC-2 type transport system ATP-binding protein
MTRQMIGSMDAPLVAVRGLQLRFGPRATLAGIDLQVAPGQVHGLLGPAGAGKSVFLRVLAGELSFGAGTVEVAAPTVLVGGGEPVELPAIEAQLAPATRFRIALARAVASEPAVLFVDEPSGGFDSATAAAARALATRHVGHGGACVWATRRLDSLHGLASGVTLLAAGRVRYSGSVEALAVRALAGTAEHWEQSLERAA